MAADSLLSLAASATVAATTNGTALTLPSGITRRGMYARVIVYDGHSSTTNTAVFQVDVSPDSGSTWYAKTVDNEHILSLTSTVQTAELSIPIETSDTQIRLTVTIAGAGTASVKYQGDLVLARPG